MKTLAPALISLSLFFCAHVMAGVGHDHGHSHTPPSVNQQVAGNKAEAVVVSLVKRKKLIKVGQLSKQALLRKNTQWPF